VRSFQPDFALALSRQAESDRHGGLARGHNGLWLLLLSHLRPLPCPV